MALPDPVFGLGGTDTPVCVRTKRISLRAPSSSLHNAAFELAYVPVALDSPAIDAIALLPDRHFSSPPFPVFESPQNPLVRPVLVAQLCTTRMRKVLFPHRIAPPKMEHDELPRRIREEITLDSRSPVRRPSLRAEPDSNGLSRPQRLRRLPLRRRNSRKRPGVPPSYLLPRATFRSGTGATTGALRGKRAATERDRAGPTNRPHRSANFC